MKINFKGKYQGDPRLLIRRCGYGEHMVRQGLKIERSYVKRLSGGGFYPRFHAYIDSEADGFTINLHLDQKQPSYEGFSAHNGEYDGMVVEAEGERIRQAIEEMKI